MGHAIDCVVLSVCILCECTCTSCVKYPVDTVALYDSPSLDFGKFENRADLNKWVQQLKEEYDAENTAWRQAIAEKARKQLLESEKQLKATYQAERDQQIDMVSSTAVQA
jgi:hypothetical protein